MTPDQNRQGLMIARNDRRAIIPLTSPNVVLGRSQRSNDVILPSATVSRTHAILTRQGGVWWVRDLGSRVGVLHGDEAISGPTQVTGALVLGGYTLELVPWLEEEPWGFDQLVGEIRALIHGSAPEWCAPWVERAMLHWPERVHDELTPYLLSYNAFEKWMGSRWVLEQLCERVHLTGGLKPWLIEHS